MSKIDEFVKEWAGTEDFTHADAIIRQRAKLRADFRAAVESLFPSDEEKKTWLKSHGYYGSCTEEYYEGLEEGVEWIRSRLLAAIDAKDDAEEQV